MSKYPILYRRSSGVELPIEEMNDFHLVAAYNKRKEQLEDTAVLQGAAMQEEDSPDDDALLVGMFEEMEERGLDPQFKGGKPPMQDEQPPDTEPDEEVPF